MEIQTEDSFPFSCQKCFKKFKFFLNLALHVQVEHKKESDIELKIVVKDEVPLISAETLKNEISRNKTKTQGIKEMINEQNPALVG